MSRILLKTMGFSWILFFIVVLSDHVLAWENVDKTQGSCNRTRTLITNSSWGIISDGNANYTQDSYCEWLIQAEPHNYITLKIHQVRTECSYDYLFVFDGDSYTRNSTLLASFSGASIHGATLLARSSKMLILLYSDTNYALEGFHAEYFVTRCPLNCSESQNAGKCVPAFTIGDDSPGRYRCSCLPSFTGDGCEISNKDLDNLLISANSYSNLLHRVGHSAVRVHHKVYIFGGFNLNRVVNDLKIYDLETGQIHDYNPLESHLSESEKNMTENDIKSDLVWPQARYAHASAEYKSGFFIHGGRLSNGDGISDELFYFNVTTLKWRRVAGSLESIPRLVYHTMTATPDGDFYVYGGGSPNGSFSSNLYRFSADAVADTPWEHVLSLCCTKAKDRAVLGHSAVYWKAEKALIYYGGITIDSGRFSKISSQMFFFSLATGIWTEISYRKAFQNYNQAYKPGTVNGIGPLSSWSQTERAFHTMDIIGHHLLILGGYTHAHNKDETCYSQQMLIYNLDCQQFVPGSSPRIQGFGHTIDGVFGHKTAVFRERVYIFGGYRGFLEGRVRSITLPFKSHRSNDGECLHTDRWSCSSDSQCGWCPSDEKCYERMSGSKNCTTNLQTSQCPGKCPLVTSCRACAALGCQWCDALEQCLDKTSSSVCGTRNLSTDYRSCIRNYDRQGVTVFEYRHPKDLENPDLVKIANSTQFKLQRESSSYIHSAGSTVMLVKGFLVGVLQNPRRIELCGAQGRINLTMENQGFGPVTVSVNEASSSRFTAQKEFLEAHLKWTPDTMCINLTWPSGLAVLLHPDSKIKFELSTDTSLVINPNTAVRVNLQLKLVARNSSAIPGTFPVVVPTPFRITKDSLVPFKTSNASCPTYVSCMNCVGDSACVWVNGRTCVGREKTSYLDDQLLNETSIVLGPQDCPQCVERSNCMECLTNRGILTNSSLPECEWWEEESVCVRYGRSDSAVRTTAGCPTNCNTRSNCSSCLEGPGKCVWCADKQECFVFDVYTSYFQYGQCVHWLDKSNQCQRCARQSKCDDCITYLGCGWSYDDNGGSCTEGDFQGPLKAPEVDWNVLTNTTEKPMSWAYASCPDMDECALGIHDCHENATCENTPGSFVCKCKQGFAGDGKKLCEETCFEPCVHGTCSPAFVCECDVGWSGVDCSIDCGCNNHSFCETGGCDECRDWTEGDRCQLCKPGSYGNATDVNIGCRECECNEQGDAARGHCNITTGECFCLNNTAGPDCSYCAEGFFGNPTNGAPCYKDCSGRGLMETSSGYFGLSPSSTLRRESMKSLFFAASENEPDVEHCMWILKLNESTESNDLRSRKLKLVISPNYNIPCWENSLAVYNGIPSFTKSRKDATLVASVCSPDSVVMSAEDAELKSPYGNRRWFQKSDGGRHLEIYVESDVVSVVLRSIPTKIASNESIYFTSSYEFVNDTESPRTAASGGILSFTLDYSKIPVNRLYDGQSVFSRFGHSLHADESNVWIFGGYSMSHGPLNDVRQFSRRIGKWIPLTILINQNEDSAPLPRYFHAGTLGPNNDDLFVHGGVAMNMTFLSDTWRFDTRLSKWSKVGRKRTSLDGLRLAGHTMTLRKKSLPASMNSPDEVVDPSDHQHAHHAGIHQLVIIGGMNSDQGFANRTWALRLDTSAAANTVTSSDSPVVAEEWEEVLTSGAVPVGLYGHSTVYHEITDSFYVFGGITYDTGKVKTSNALYALHWPSRRWTVLPPTEDHQIFKSLPVPKFFHAAVTTDSFMVVLGGSGSARNTTIMAYNYKCNLWTLLEGESKLLDRTGAGAAVSEDDLLLMGGWDWSTAATSESLFQMALPKDLCGVQIASERCKATYGCSYCFSNNNQSQQCYDSEMSMPNECSMKLSGTDLKISFLGGVVCNKNWLEKRNCNQYLSCTECLSSWPSHPDAKPVCQWCTNCQVGRCIPIGKKCQEENICNHKQRETLDVNQCAERVCSAADCETCINGKCVWTRQILRSSEWSWKLHPKPVYDWNCVRKQVFNTSTASYKVAASPPEQCPSPCSSFGSCDSCLASVGGEGGFQECWWSVSKNLCLSPAHVYLLCFGGVCGPLLKEDVKVCPLSCSSFTNCASCLQNPTCGWCASIGENGQGKCLPGDSVSSTTEDCTFRTTFVENDNGTSTEIEQGHSWHYLKCPAENECENFHHTCDEASEKCIDLENGYRCECKDGYRLDYTKKSCSPICEDGCIHGTCVSPGKCSCHFGYVGQNCSAQCNCNGHSNCVGVNDLNNCTECMNDTMGPQCSKCKPLFVGDPRNGRPCISCFDFCNGHSNICLPQRAYNVLCGNKNFDEADLLSRIQSNSSFFGENGEELSIIGGPGESHVCCGCGDRTKGSKCEDCLEGHFRGNDDKRKPCRKCECHGHGHLCDPVFGISCNCQNNTESETCSSNPTKFAQCYKFQCAKCRESYLGTPTNGHQCYKHMFVDNEYCFGPNYQDSCVAAHQALHSGRTVFFAVQPKFMNVHIRVNLDVNKGAVHLYISPKDDTFIVENDANTFMHQVQFDGKYGLNGQHYGGRDSGLPLREEAMRDLDDHYPNISALIKDMTTLHSHRVMNPLSPSLMFSQTPYRLIEEEAASFATHIRLDDPRAILVVRNVRNRLVITLPYEAHELRSTRFFIVLEGVGDKSFGALSFRQDQLHIDLFVFFSVFFSAFFLFLAACGIAWKVKQNMETRRARHRHVAEMLSMAKRPFAICTMLLEPEQSSHLYQSYLQCRKACRKGCICTRPLATESTHDGSSAVCTMMVSLPGGSSAPVRLCLGSALANFNSRPHPQGNLRRRRR